VGLIRQEKPMDVQRADPQIPATYADVEALPPHVTGQIIYGALHAQPRPAPRHTRAASTLGFEVGSRYDRGGGGWIILVEPEVHWGGNVVVPDIAGWRRERMTALPETAYFETVPDWICEVLSPSTRRLDKVEKRALYAEMGVAHLWHVDPEHRTLEVFTLKGGEWLLTHVREGDDTCDVPPFDAVPFGLGALWTL